MSIDSLIHLHLKSRQAQGIAAARARGVHLGRRAIPVPDDFEQIVNDWRQGKITAEEAQKKCKMKETTFYRRYREYRSSQPNYK